MEVVDFRIFCYDTYRFLLEKFPWASFTPTVHKVMAHSWEIIRPNDECGLESLSEEGLESCNNVLGWYDFHIREKLVSKLILQIA